MTPADLAATIQMALDAALKARTLAPAEDGHAALVTTLADAIKSSRGFRRLTVGERGAAKTPFNPTGAPRTLKRRYFVNTYEVRPRSLHTSEIQILEGLSAGTYCKGQFKVAVVGENTATPEVHILWANKQPESRVIIYKQYGNFAGILQAIAADQEAQATERREFAEFQRHKQLATSPS